MDADGTYDEESQAQAIKEQVVEWWETVERKGEKQVLVDAVSAGTWPYGQAELLARKYPEVAVAAIKIGIERALSGSVVDDMDIHVAPFLVSALEHVGTPEALEAAKMYMTKGKDTRLRLNAAKIVAEHDRGLATDAMLQAWSDVVEAGYDGWAREELIVFLVESRSASVLRILTTTVPDGPVRCTIGLIGALDLIRYDRYIVSEGEGTLPPEDFMAEAELFLIEALGDDRRDASSDASSIADRAAKRLGDSWPDKYVFDSSAAPYVKRRQAVQFKNTWLASNGRPPIPLPKRAEVDSLADSKVRPLVERSLHSTDQSERAKALNEIRSLGLPALRSVLDELEYGDAYAEHRPGLEEVAKRLSCTVRSVLVYGGGEQGAQITQAVRSLKGKTLTTQSLRIALNESLAGQGEETHYASFEIARDDDGTGIEIAVYFHPSTATEDWLSGATISVDLEGSNIMNGFGGSDSDVMTESYGPSSFKRAVHKVLDSDPREVFWIVYISVRERD